MHGRDGHLGHVIINICEKFHFLNLRRIYMKFERSSRDKACIFSG